MVEDCGTPRGGGVKFLWVSIAVCGLLYIYIWFGIESVVVVGSMHAFAVGGVADAVAGKLERYTRYD